MTLYSPRFNKSTPWGATFFALLGLLWCGYVAFPISKPPCTLSGCSLFQDGKIFGISLWWIGGAFFFVETILCLRGMRFLAYQLARLALFFDCILMLIMFFTAPCSYCIIVAVFLALTYFCLRIPGGNGGLRDKARFGMLLFPVWCGLMLGNTVLLVDEFTPRWSIAGDEAAEVSIYFSPSCKYCHNAMLAAEGKARLYPIVRDEGDLEAVLRLEHLLSQHVPMAEALERAMSADEPVPPTSAFKRLISLPIQLLRNKTYVFKHGHGMLPLVVISGGPGAETVARPSASPQPSSESSPGREPSSEVPANATPENGMTYHNNEPGQQQQGVLPWNLDSTGRCDETVEDCP